jgi:hypothetical protein
MTRTEMAGRTFQAGNLPLRPSVRHDFTPLSFLPGHVAFWDAAASRAMQLWRLGLRV